MTEQMVSWKSRNFASALSGLDRSGLAFEFLRRNPSYREDYRRAIEDIASGRADRDAAMTALSRRWRCFFRRRPGSGGATAAVFGGGRTGHGDRHGRAGGVCGQADAINPTRDDIAIGGIGDTRKDDRS